jgi:elongation factor P hydroxylase
MSAGFCRQLEEVFSDCFAARYRTLLQGGAPEPVYLPAGHGGEYNLLRYREDYPASALHEVAHWCIAGKLRRGQVDFGYWYAPDGRDRQAQRAFETVEVKPQAVEWHFSLASGLPFRVSLDNLDGDGGDNGRFSESVSAQACRYSRHGLPARAAEFRDALAAVFGGEAAPLASDFGTGA